MMNALLFLFQATDAPTVSTPSTPRVWLFFLAFGVIGFVACRVIFWLLPLVLVFEGTIIMGILSALRDPAMRDAINQQAPGYLKQAYLAILIAFILPCLGSLQAWRTRARTRK